MENEILFIYDSHDLADREALAYAHSLRFHKVREVNIRDRMPTRLQLSQISELLAIQSTGLIDKASEKYKKDFASLALDDHDWLESITKNPELLKTPIAIHEKKAEIIETPKQLGKMDLELRDERSDFDNLPFTDGKLKTCPYRSYLRQTQLANIIRTMIYRSR